MNASERGVVYIALGATWRSHVALSIGTLKAQNPYLQVWIMTDGEVKGADERLQLPYPYPQKITTDRQLSRWAKTALADANTPDRCMYLDADTQVCGSLEAYFAPLDSGFDMVITASINQGAHMLRHATPDERLVTLNEVGTGAVQLQAGAFSWARNERTRTLFATWRQQWWRWADVDQGALMRAIRVSGVRLWLLGRDFNGGSVVKHRSAGG